MDLLEGSNDKGQCSIQIKIALNKIRVQFNTEQAQGERLISFLTQIFNNKKARVPRYASSYNIAGSYGRVWMFVPPDDAVNENGRLDFWYPADSLSSAEVKQLIQTIAPMATMDGVNIPENLFQLLQKREYKDFFSPPVYLSCDALLACLQRFYQAVDELACTKGFALIDVAVGKTSPSKYKAKHTGTFFNSRVSIEGDGLKQDNTLVGNFSIPNIG